MTACPSKLRVAHVTQGLDMGGLEKLLVEFARHADRRRFDLRFVSLTDRGDLADEIEAVGCPVVSFSAASGFRPRLVFRLASLFRRWRIDAVHTHDDRPLIYAAPAARLARVRRAIHTRHGQSPQLTSRQRMLVEVAAHLVDRFVCVSEDAARLTIQAGVSPRRVCCVWNGIDLERFAYAEPKADGPMVTVARFSPEKGIEWLVRAVAAVRAQDRLQLEIAGDGPCLPGLRRLVEELGLTDHIRFLGQVSDIPSLLARASLFVLPSLSEGIALTVLEAMACGLPVVATRVGGNCEAVVDGCTGLLVPPRDPAALAAALLRLHADPATSRAMGQAGRQRVEEWFDIRRMVATYESLYDAASHPIRASDCEGVPA